MTALSLDHREVLVYGCRERNAVWVDRGWLCRARHHPGFESFNFDGLKPGRFGYGREVSNGLAVTLAALFPRVV